MPDQKAFPEAHPFPLCCLYVCLCTFFSLYCTASFPFMSSVSFPPVALFSDCIRLIRLLRGTKINSQWIENGCCCWSDRSSQQPLFFPYCVALQNSYCVFFLFVISILLFVALCCCVRISHFPLGVMVTDASN